VTDKHGTRFRLYQYTGEYRGLNIEIPRAFDRPPVNPKPVPKLSPTIAYYLAYAILHREFISRTYKDLLYSHVLQILLYLLSEDTFELEKAETSESKVPIITTWKFREATF